MSARDDILNGLRQLDESQPGDMTPEELLDAYRAEVLREAADALEARVADVDVDTKRTWAGMDAAYLRRMADEEAVR